MSDPSFLLGEFQSLTTTPQSVSSGGNIVLTSVYAANVSTSTPYWLHFLKPNGTRRWSMLVSPNYSGFLFDVPGGITGISGLKIAASTAKDSVTGSPGTDVDVSLFGRELPS